MNEQHTNKTDETHGRADADTEQQSLPPAAAGGLTQPSTEAELTPEGVTHTLSQLQQENEQLRASLRLAQAHRQITDELAKAGAQTPELLFETVKADLQFGEDGKPANTAALIAKLRRRYPEQFRIASADQIGAGAGTADNRRPLSRETLARMSPTEIAKMDWAEVKRALAS